MLTIILVLCNILSALSPAVNLYITKLMIDQISGFIMKTNTSTLEDFYWLIAILIGTWVALHLIDMVKSSVTPILQIKIEQNTQLTIMHKCSEMDIVFFEDPTNYNMLDNATIGASGQIYAVIVSFFAFIQSTIILFSFIGILFRFNWLVLFIVIVTCLPQLWADNYLVKKRWDIQLSLSEPRRLRNFYTAFMVQRDSAKEVRLFGLLDTFLQRFRYFANRFIEIEIDFIKKKSWINGWLGLIPLAGYAFIWILIIQSGIKGQISIGDIVLYTGAASNCQSAFNGLFSIGSQLYQTLLNLGIFFNFLDLNPLTVEGALKGTLENQRYGNLQLGPKLSRGIEFRNVSFSYPGTKVKILNQISFTLKPGETTAIVGKNGAGKTTLIKLLVRFYDPTEGEILLDGVNIKEYDLKSLQKCFGVIFQDFVRYPLTARENIGFGQVEYLNDLTRIRNASIKAGSHEFIEKLSAQYESYLGRIFAGSGEDLSQGQWQRVSLARALMRENALVLILDEPTAALDAFAEYEVYEQFNTLKADKLSIIISHRFSTVRSAHHILVLDEGRLVDEGAHEELMAHHGLYEEMYNLQANQYK